ncbi:NAD-dependent epimerase/dehydratase family protein [Halococcus saccharolyticus]|uniref:NAD-dependent epimerase/dehydratase n=1 Tax=Halococcus saccharolyticus DSM 5350 TaxID=1227455 RepID=M0MJW3_9EURY|nr:NAD-dependent epimerase/dehydratase family protein [Halococcus saccharolyticus]EMA44745.1 NAD-dependent epimerase/dehydratase [Halococcus saccharolyticus DSM 5350]
MPHAMIIGGTRFIGRHTVRELLDNEYDVTVFNRGNHENPFADDEAVAHVAGDRTNENAVERAAREVDPDIVIDCVAYHPSEVRHATAVFADCEAYVAISSGSAYGDEEIPKREDTTTLHDCTDEQATDDSMDSYGPRKAEIDRAVAAAADEGVNAMSVRPPVVYGPHDYTERFDYWINRVLNHDRVIVPGDGDCLWHLVFAPDVASGLRTVAEAGEPGETYNVGDRRLPVLAEWVELIADTLDTDVEIVTANERELAAAELAPGDFPLYRSYPHVLSTAKIAELGWEATPIETALERTVENHQASDRTGRENGPDREAEERVLSVLDTL